MRTHAATVPDLAAAMLPGPYRIPAYRAQAHIRLTNKTPCGTYRAPGRFESTFVRERLLDAIADKLGLDRVEIRRRNLIARQEMPYARPLETLGTEIIFDSGDYAGLLDKALAAVEWPLLCEKLAARRAAGELVGAGVALFVEKSGLGPSDLVRISVDGDGMVEVVRVRLRSVRAWKPSSRKSAPTRSGSITGKSVLPTGLRTGSTRNGSVRLPCYGHDW